VCCRKSRGGVSARAVGRRRFVRREQSVSRRAAVIVRLRALSAAPRPQEGLGLGRLRRQPGVWLQVSTFTVNHPVAKLTEAQNTLTYLRQAICHLLGDSIWVPSIEGEPLGTYLSVVISLILVV